ncbi:MAG TPA: helix-turn-helix domain-containing protein [Nocardioides sp.]|nr:helix-turn-helix domain-containing protein [Nocardioides sp.]
MPRDGTATRERIVEAAVDLVIERGFRATTVEAVIGAAKTSKGAFFHHFASKQALADALVEYYVAGDLAMLDRGLAVASGYDDPVDRAVGFLAHFEGIADEIMAGTTGCLYTSVLAEMGLIESGTSDPIARAVALWREGCAGLLRDALGARAATVDVDALADHLFVTFEGAFLLARSTGEPEHLRRQLAVLRSLVESLLRRP